MTMKSTIGMLQMVVFFLLIITKSQSACSNDSVGLKQPEVNLKVSDDAGPDELSGSSDAIQVAEDEISRLGPSVLSSLRESKLDELIKVMEAKERAESMPKERRYFIDLDDRHVAEWPQRGIKVIELGEDEPESGREWIQVGANNNRPLSLAQGQDIDKRYLHPLYTVRPSFNYGIGKESRAARQEHLALYNMLNRLQAANSAAASGANKQQRMSAAGLRSKVIGSGSFGDQGYISAGGPTSGAVGNPSLARSLIEQKRMNLRNWGNMHGMWGKRSGGGFVIRGEEQPKQHDLQQQTVNPM